MFKSSANKKNKNTPIILNGTYQMRLCQESTFSSGRTSFTFTYFWDYFTPAPSLDVNSSLHVCTVLPLIDPSYPTLCKPDFWTSPCYSEQWVTICNCLIVIKWKMIMIITSRICHKNHSQKIRRSRELNFKFGLKIKETYRLSFQLVSCKKGSIFISPNSRCLRGLSFLLSSSF